jgi:hypothetical protein
MKNLFIFLSFFISVTIEAQFLEQNPPTSYELELNNETEFSEIYKLANQALAEKNYENFLKTVNKLVELKPNNPDLQFKLAEAYALSDKKTEAFNTLIKIQKQGLYYDLSNNDNFNNINKFPVFEYIKNNMDTSAIHYGEGQKVFSIDSTNSALLFESIEFDPSSLSFLLGSVRDGSIIKINDQGQASVFVAATDGGVEGPWAVFDMKADPKNDVLWVASSSVSQYSKMTKDTYGKAGLFKYQLSTGKLMDQFLLPDVKKPQLISSLDVTSSGDVYFIETYHNVILKLENNSKDIKLILSSPIYKNMRSITLDSNGQFLFFSDVEKGIVSVNLTTKSFIPMGNSETLNLTGISDLIFDEDGLLIIQNAIKPQRIMRLDLDESKAKVINILPIESAHPSFNYPSVGTVVGNELYYFANSQWSKTNPLGGLAKNKQWEKLSILRSEKRYNVKGREEYNQEINRHKKKAEDAGF